VKWHCSAFSINLPIKGDEFVELLGRYGLLKKDSALVSLSWRSSNGETPLKGRWNLCWWIWEYAAVSVGLVLRPAAVVLIRSELRFCLLDKVCLVCFSGIHHSCYGRLFCRQVRTSVKRGMTEVRFGDFVVGIDRRMFLRHEFLIQNYSGGTAIMIGENIQCNSDRASSKCITLFCRPWKAVNRKSPLQLPAT